MWTDSLINWVYNSGEMKKNLVKVSSNRSFGFLFFVVFLAVSLWPLKSQGDLRLWAFILSLIFLVLGILNSRFLTPLNKLWYKFGIFSNGNLTVYEILRTTERTTNPSQPVTSSNFHLKLSSNEKHFNNWKTSYNLY